MTVSGTSAASATSAATSTKTATTSSSSATNTINADFDTFLKLLTTQMQNQDPLQPMDSTEFVAQLASFSAVEQQIRTNDQLESILGAVSGGSASLAEWIGRKVQAPGNAEFDGTPIEVGVAAVDDTDRTMLVVKNDFGTVVSSTEIDPSSGTATWDGTNSTTGEAVSHGTYGFSVESYKGDDLVATTAGKVFSTVQEVRIVDGEPVLIVDDGSQVAVADVSAVK